MEIIMGKKVTKAADNIYCQARYEALENNDAFSSREKTSEIIHIDRTRLANIELGNVVPYPEEVLAMSQAYNSPELCNAHCSQSCPIGKQTVSKVTLDDFDRLSLKVLGSLKDVDELRLSLISISEDGVVDAYEKEEFYRILDTLEKISTSAKALQIWAQKNVKFD